MTMLRVLALLLLSLVTSAARSDFVSEGPEVVELTVYRTHEVLTSELSLDEESDGIAMITETRTIEVTRGTSVVSFRGVADAMVPQTAKLEGIAATVVEANFDYNLLTPGTLLAKSLGRTVRLSRTNPATGEVMERRGVLRSGPDGVVVDFGGDIEALNCSGLNERLVFDEVPATLADTPTLSMVIRTPEAGRFTVQLSYLALGLDWSTDYVLRIHPDGRRLDLSAWLTLVNRHRTQFTAATTHVVAGSLAREDETKPPEIVTPKQQDRCWPIGQFRLVRRPPAPIVGGAYARAFGVQDSPIAESVVVTGNFIASVRELGDYKQYTLPTATTVAPSQMKQVRMLSEPNVRFERLYEYRIDENSFPADPDLDSGRPWVLLRLENRERDGLGVALPGGTVAVMEGDERGRLILAGENTISDTPIGSPLDIPYARAMDVWVSPRVVEDTTFERSEGRGVRRTFEIQVGNDKPVAVRLEVVHQPDNTDDFRVMRQSRRHVMKHGQPRWSIRLRAGQRYLLRYTVEHAQ